MSWTEIVSSDTQTNFCTQHVLPMFCKKKSFWQRFTCNSDQPSVIPLQALADHNLPKVDKFIKEVKKHLSAYSSRYHQVSLLTKHFNKGEVHDIDCNEDFTLIKFALVIGDSQADDLNLHLALRYGNTGCGVFKWGDIIFKNWHKNLINQ